MGAASRDAGHAQKVAVRLCPGRSESIWFMTHGSCKLTTVPATSAKWNQFCIQWLPTGIMDPTDLRRLPLSVVTADEQDPIAGPCSQEKIKQRRNGRRQGHWIIQELGRSNQWQDLFHGFSKGRQASLQPPFPLGRADALELLANGVEKSVAVEVLILVQVVADTHPHGIERRRLVGKTGDNDSHDVRVEEIEVLQQSETVIARAEVPIENGQVDGVLIGVNQRRFRVLGRKNAAVQTGTLKPFMEGAAHRFLIVNYQDRLGNPIVFRHESDLSL